MLELADYKMIKDCASDIKHKLTDIKNELNVSAHNNQSTLQLLLREQIKTNLFLESILKSMNSEKDIP